MSTLVDYSSSLAGDGQAISMLKAQLSESAYLLEYGSEEWITRMQAYSPQGDQTPAYIIECATEEDVVLAVNFARSLNLPLTARNGAHNLAELSNVHGGVMISQSHRVNVSHDLERNTVTFEGGAQFRHIDEYLNRNVPGFVFQSAMISSIGCTGSHGAVGVGWLQRKLGSGIDNIVSMRIVVADGSVMTASDEENSDLFFAVRGAAPSFGIITEITERMYNICDPQQGKEVRVGCFFFELDDGEKVWDAISYMDNDPDFPDAAFILPLFILFNGKPGIILWFLHYKYEDGDIDVSITKWETLIRQLVDDTNAVALTPNSLALSAGDGWEFISHEETQLLFNPPWMCSFYPTGGFVSRTNAEKVFKGILEYWRTSTQPEGAENVPFHTTAFYHFGSKVMRSRKLTAWPGNAETNWLCATWGGVLLDQDPVQRAERRKQTIRWVDNMFKDIRFDLQYGYICAAAYNWRSVNYAKWIHGESYDTLVAIKQKYDPENVFRNNVNIPAKRL